MYLTNKQKTEILKTLIVQFITKRCQSDEEFKHTNNNTTGRIRHSVVTNECNKCLRNFVHFTKNFFVNDAAFKAMSFFASNFLLSLRPLQVSQF